jgi:hypothetical protein
MMGQKERFFPAQSSNLHLGQQETVEWHIRYRKEQRCKFGLSFQSRKEKAAAFGIPNLHMGTHMLDEMKKQREHKHACMHAWV